MSIKECRTSIELLESLYTNMGLLWLTKSFGSSTLITSRSSHLTPRLLPHWVWRVKYIRNFFTTSCWYVLGLDNK